MLLVFSPALGMSRDWITLVIYPTGVIIASAYGVLHFLEPALLRRRILLLAAGITFASSTSWIVLNSSADTALARFKVLPNETTWGVKTQASAYEELAILYRKHMDATNAIANYRKYLEVDSTNGRIWSGLANIYLLIGDEDRQMACSEEAINHGVSYVDVYNELGLLYASRNRFEDAIAVTRKGLVQNPQSAVAYHNLGTFILQRDSNVYKEAVPYFARAVDLNPSYSKACYEAGMCWYHLKDFDACIFYLQRYLQLAPNTQRAAAVEALLRSLQKRG
jgi:tetratricopeptide (TPR) repeat protein